MNGKFERKTTQKQRDDIRAFCETEIENREWCEKAREAIAALLDDLEETEKFMYETQGSHDMILDELTKAIAGLNYYKTRAEALETAMQIVAACKFCKHFCTDKCDTCSEREWENWHGKRYAMTIENNWEFDEEKFTKGGKPE